MTIKHWAAISAFLLLFLVMYLGCDTKPPEQVAIEKSRALNAESTDITNLEREAMASLEGIAANDICDIGWIQIVVVFTNFNPFATNQTVVLCHVISFLLYIKCDFQMSDNCSTTEVSSDFRMSFSGLNGGIRFSHIT